jgi:hypothetical protein
VWTASTGVVDVQQWLAGQGVLVDPNFTITSMFTVTPDGTQLFGSGTMLVPPYTRKAFKITRPPNQVAVATPGHKAGLELRAPSPNPSSSVTRLDFTLTSASSVDLSIYDTSGRKVSTLLHDNVPAGQRSVTWDGRGADGRPASAGLYYARLATPEGFRSRPIVRVR